jgi:hypothetical protein
MIAAAVAGVEMLPLGLSDEGAIARPVCGSQSVEVRWMAL